MTLQAMITKDDRWDPLAGVNRKGWAIAVSDGRTKRTTTRREASEWCEEMDIEVVHAFPLSVGDRVRINFDGREMTVTEIHPPNTDKNRTATHTYTVEDAKGWSHTEYGSTVTLIERKQQ